MTDEQREQESVERMPAACEPAADISPETIARVLAGLNPHDPQDMTVIGPIICAQAAEIERLREALRPFASAWSIAQATGCTSMSRLALIARDETAGVYFMRARSALQDKNND